MEFDKTLIEKFRSGDVKSFEQIFHGLYKALVQYANTLLKDMDEAEDKVQQVFVTLWEKRGSLEVHTSLRAYLYRAVHNACLNRLKQDKIKQEHARVIGMNQNSTNEQDRMEGK